MDRLETNNPSRCTMKLQLCTQLYHMKQQSDHDDEREMLTEMVCPIRLKEYGGRIF